MSLGPSSASDPSALTSTRKSLIMERMGDKDIVKRAFKSFQKSYDLDASVDKQKPALKQVCLYLLMFFISQFIKDYPLISCLNIRILQSQQVFHQ